ncbi:uncharacterized protein [Linepithema humile]|uniref:uncharacterized protein n=1 Tax=Linepithema humile TaxID=83485 RepID=UPI00351E2A0D
MLKTIRRVRESPLMYTIAIKRGFRSHLRGLMDLRLKHFKQKLTPMEQLMEGVLLRCNVRMAAKLDERTSFGLISVRTGKGQRRSRKRNRSDRLRDEACILREDLGESHSWILAPPRREGKGQTYNMI